MPTTFQMFCCHVIPTNVWEELVVGSEISDVILALEMLSGRDKKFSHLCVPDTSMREPGNTLACLMWRGERPKPGPRESLER